MLITQRNIQHYPCSAILYFRVTMATSWCVFQRSRTTDYRTKRRWCGQCNRNSLDTNTKKGSNSVMCFTWGP